MKPVILFVLSCLFVNLELIAQTNFVYNPDFEAMDIGEINDGQGQVNKLQSWECRTNEINYGSSNQPTYYYLHSPDLYTPNYSPATQFTGLNFNVTPPGQPHSGANMVGMLPYELIQQRFNNQNMIGGELYTLSMYIWLPDDDPSWWQNHELNVFLAKNRIEYKEENNNMCSQNYIEYDLSFNQRFNIGQKTLSLSTYPTNNWHRISFTFKAPNDITAAWDWIVIDVNRINYVSDCGQVDPCGNCQGAYLFIDDVDLTEADYCNAICSPPKWLQGPINIVMRSPNDQLISSCQPWYIIVQNAIGIQLEVFNRWGQLIYEQNALDVNILVDDGYNDYFFGWLGQASNGDYIFTDSYPFKLHIWNCNYDEYIVSDMVNVFGNCSGSVQGYDIVNPELNNCCPQIVYVQNKVYSPSIIHFPVGADQYIYAGSNVTTSQPSGPVVVQAGAKVKYVAGTDVVLNPGFVAQTGSNFSALVEPCAYSQRIMKNDRRSTFFQKSNVKDSAQLAIESITISPNPSDGFFSVTNSASKNTITSIVVTSMEGVQLKEFKFVDNYINLREFSNGVYLITLIKNDLSFEQKKIVIMK